ncbi:MAG TPA: TonB-dependent receptor [Terriglobales bacterium]|nr:TonB-dependent receptor [Terriglobales bacterium]
MKYSRSHLSLVIVFLSLLLAASSASAQYRGSLRGTVTDPSGAVVSGATVTLTDTNTGRALTSTSDANGIYQFNALPPAPYRLTAEAQGFKQRVLENVQIIPEQPNALDLQLEVGQTTETVTVTGTTQALDTETATISGTINSNQIQHMPSFGRDVLQLTQLAPGVFGDRAQGSGGGGQNLPGTQGPGATGGNQGIFQTENGPQALAAGQQYENNGISIDGISTTSAVWGGTTIITPSEDSVDNVKVVSNAYDAENGRFSGAQIQITSKSGTNNFHGSLFFEAHRPGLDAYQRFNGQGNKVLRDDSFFDQLGGSVGGPIWKNKVFAFFNYETVRSPQAQTNIANGWYDTPSFDSSAPAGSIAATYLSFPGSAVVNRGINPSTCTDAGFIEGVNCRTIAGQGLDIGSPLTSGLGTQDSTWVSPTNPGVGNGLDGVADIANYITASQSHFSKAQYNGRLDANISDIDRIGFAIYWVPQTTTFLNGPARQYNFFHHDQVNDAFSAIWNHTFSSSFLNEFRVNAAGWRWNEVESNPQSPVGLPTDRIDQEGSLVNGTAIQAFGPNVGSILNQWTYSYKDVATKIMGKHTVKFGGDITRLFYLQNCAGCGVPSYNFFNIWDFLNDAPHTENGGFNPSTGFPTTIRQDDRENIWGLFVQDDFKVRRNLTLNLGLRYSYFGPLSAKQGNMLRAVPGAGANFLTDLSIRKASSWNAQKGNFGPQVGFAWSPSMFNDKLVVRGGYGLNYNQEEIAVSSNIVNNPGLVVFPTLTMSTPTSPNPGIIYATASDPHSLTSYPANPNTIVSFGPNGLPVGATGINITLFPNDLPTIRVHHYSLDTQYDLGHHLVATVGYMGTKSENLLFHQHPNAAAAAKGFTLNPQIGGGDFWDGSGHANYNALLAELKHQFAHNFSADAQFTWAKSMDTSSGPYYEQPYPYNPDLNYGPSDYNVGKAFKLFGVWQPTLFPNNRWLERVVGGWTLSGILTIHSGFPWSPLSSVQGGSLYCGTCNYSSIFPVYLGGAGSSTSNDAFKTVARSNFPNGGPAYFNPPNYTPYSGTTFGNSLPQLGIRRNSFTLPGYRDVDLTLAKAFGLPTMPVLGEEARVEFRLNAYNVFNNLNFNPLDISNNIANANFGTITGALAGRVVTLGARFSF